MSKETITIQTYAIKKGKPDQRSFECQVITIGGTRTYVLDDTKRDLNHKRFELIPGCKVFDNEVTYRVKDIWYSPRPMYVFIAVRPDYCY